MKKKLLSIIPLILFAIVFSSCEYSDMGLKTLTRPYIAQYECTEARFGKEDILEKYDYIKIILVNSKEMQITYKPKDGEKKIIETVYSLDNEKNISTEIGILGYKYRVSAPVENGKFTVTKDIAGKQLIMKFQST